MYISFGFIISKIYTSVNIMFGKSKFVFSIKRDVSKVDDNNLMPKELQFCYYENSESYSIIVQVQ